MNDSDSLTLVATRTAASCAHLFVEMTLSHWGLAIPGGRARLVVHELVTGAIAASAVHPSFLVVRLVALKGSVVVEVQDGAPYAPDHPPVAGLGLRHGFYLLDRGRAVWVELPALPVRRKPSLLPEPSPATRRERPDADLLRRVRDGLVH